MVADCAIAPDTPQRDFGTKRKEIFASDDPRNNVSKPVLNTFAQCIARRPALASQVAGGELRAAFQGARGDIDKSDVMASFKDISAKVHQPQASDKVVFLVSDMLEKLFSVELVCQSVNTKN